ncbi:MAG: DUF58 domain-containing protein [Gemmataceae bacterium]|nr:DUF58 domain-containing protein [Gemmataceae bacterium]
MTAPAPLLSPEFLHRLEQLELVTRKIFSGKMKGDKLSRRKGQSVEFADYRQYTVGDDLRFLDWNLYARLDRLFIRLFLEEEDLHVHLLVDNSLSMGFGSPTKLQFAKQVAAALGFVGLTNLDRVAVQAFNDRMTETLPALRGRRSLWRMLDFLDKLGPAGPSDLARSLKQFSMRCPGKGIAIVLSDFMDKNGFEDALRYLVARQLDIYVIHILAPEEIDPTIAGDVKLIDAEDGDAAEITVSRPLLDRYRRNLDAFRGGLHDFCSRRGITCIFAPSDTPFEGLVLNYLRRKGLVR